MWSDILSAMLRFAANLGFLFPEHPFLDRFAAARDAGFAAVEFAAPYAHQPGEIAARLRDHGLECVLFNLPYGADARSPLESVACDPAATAQFRSGVERALEYARALGNRRINCIAGAPPAGVEPRRCEAALVENLRYAAAELAREGITLLLEPINTRDMPGFLVATAASAAALIARAGVPNLALQCDLYHAAMMGEDPSSTLAAHRGIIRHIQFADVPGRGEPGSGTLDFRQHFETVARIAYEGWVAAEYRPTRATHETLHWLAEYS